jgi:hypothetical protein
MAHHVYRTTDGKLELLCPDGPVDGIESAVVFFFRVGGSHVEYEMDGPTLDELQVFLQGVSELQRMRRPDDEELRYGRRRRLRSIANPPIGDAGMAERAKALVLEIAADDELVATLQAKGLAADPHREPTEQPSELDDDSTHQAPTGAPDPTTAGIRLATHLLAVDRACEELPPGAAPAVRKAVEAMAAEVRSWGAS